MSLLHPAFENDERFQGSSEYKRADSRRENCDKVWMVFLADAYCSILPHERPKLSLTDEEKKEMNKGDPKKKMKIEGSKRAETDLETEVASSVDSDDDDKARFASASAAFSNDHPGLADGFDIWQAYITDSHRFDMSKGYV